MNPSKHLGNELKYLERALMNPDSECWVHTLEQRFKEKFKTRFAIAMNSGTAPLHAALMAADVSLFENVISPALTVIMDTAAIRHVGAFPVYADVDPNTWTISPYDIEDKITEYTRAIIAVAFYGLPPNMDAIMEIADEHDLFVIEDNAQAFNPEYGLRGHFATYSFETSKHLSCGEGGMLLTNDKLLAERARKFAGHGYAALRADDGRLNVDQNVFQNPAYKRHDTIGYNYRMSEFSAAIVLAQLERSAELVGLRKKTAAHYDNAISHCNFLERQSIPDGYPHSYFTYGALYYPENNNGITWEAFRKRYMLNGGDGIYGCWQVPYHEPVIASFGGDCPIAEELQPRLMQFKTNYRSEELAIKKAEALYTTIMDCQRGMI